MTRHDIDEPIELDRFELIPIGGSVSGMPRREFLKLVGCGLLILVTSNSSAQEAAGSRSEAGTVESWLHIGSDGSIRVFTGKVEVGQNIRTSLTQAVAEELRVDPAAITMVMADTDLTPYDQGTFGSRTTPTMNFQLRRAAAAARESLLDLAAEQWKVPRSSLSITSGQIVHGPSNRRASYGSLTGSQRLMREIRDDALTPPAAWTVMGKSRGKMNARSIVTGSHRYASDISLPGMLFGKVLRPPAFGSTLESLEVSAAAGQGVQIVHQGQFVGAVGSDPAVVGRAIAALRPKWKNIPQVSEKSLAEHFRSQSPSAPHPQRVGDGGISATYTAAYIAHVPLEPRAATAKWEDGKLTVWTGTQRPFGVRSELASAFGIPEERVRVIVPDTGSGYGGKHTGETAVEAARLAKAVGKPVRVVWTREEEFTWAYFRPAALIDIHSSLSADGRLASWEHHTYNAGPSGIETPYDSGASHVQFHPTDSPLRQGSYRGLAATANHFARETHIDEMAFVAGKDALQFRLEHLKDERLRAVLRAAAEKIEWGSTENRGAVGIAAGREKGSYVATAVLLSATVGKPLQIHRIASAFECGAIVNPDELKNQVEGAAIMGMGGALFEAIHFADGRILNPHLAQYRVPRFRDIPAIDVVLIDRKDIPSVGAGETPIICVAPAIGNAIYRASGVRMRSMPMRWNAS